MLTIQVIEMKSVAPTVWNENQQYLPFAELN